MRIAIVGWPKTGKSTLGEEMARDAGLPYRSTDDTLEMFKDLPEKEQWSARSLEVSRWLDQPDFLIEGVALPRALRKWKEANPGKPAPVDRIIYIGSKPFQELSRGQTAMGKGLDTVLSGLKGWLPPIENHRVMVFK